MQHGAASAVRKGKRQPSAGIIRDIAIAGKESYFYLYKRPVFYWQRGRGVSRLRNHGFSSVKGDGSSRKLLSSEQLFARHSYVVFISVCARALTLVFSVLLEHHLVLRSISGTSTRYMDGF